MKKLLLTASMVAIVAAMTVPAHAECDGIYGAFRIGGVKHDADDLQGRLDSERLMMSGALGYRWEYLRTELEYVWRKYNKDVDHFFNETAVLKTYSYMWNTYYDVLPYNWWTPYLGVGLGFSKIRYSDKALLGTNEEWKTTKFSWSLGGGLSLKVTNRLNLDLGYRYYDLGSPHARSKKYDISAQEIYGGVRYVF